MEPRRDAPNCDLRLQRRIDIPSRLLRHLPLRLRQRNALNPISQPVPNPGSTSWITFRIKTWPLKINTWPLMNTNAVTLYDLSEAYAAGHAKAPASLS